MAFETLRSVVPSTAVHAKPEAVRVKQDDREKQGGKGRRSGRPSDDHAHPITNDQGQVTGNVIDTTV